MPQFGYTSTRKMDPVPGRTYSTEYYKQSRRERQRTEDFVTAQLERIGTPALTDPAYLDQLMRPLPNYKKKESHGCYSTGEIIADMYEQLKKGNDIPSGMLGRWNRIFEGTDNQIHLAPEQVTGNTYHNLFDRV